MEQPPDLRKRDNVYGNRARLALVGPFDMIVKPKGHEVAYAYGYLANAYGLSTNEPVTRPLGPDAKLLGDALNEVEQVCRTLELPITSDYIPAVRRALAEAKTYSDVQNYVGQLRETHAFRN